MTGMYEKVSGTYKNVTAAHANISGVWKEITAGYENVSGSWKQFYSSAVPFSPFTDVYDASTPGSESEVVPSGAVQLVLYVYGPGDQGGNSQSSDEDWLDGGGGSGGGRAIKTIAIAESDWGVTLSYHVGATGSGPSTVSGTLNAGSISITVSSTASGGDSNTSGSAGDPGGHVGGPGGSGGAGVDGIAGGGTGAAGDQFANPSPGDPGRIEFRWS